MRCPGRSSQGCRLEYNNQGRGPRQHRRKNPRNGGSRWNESVMGALLLSTSKCTETTERPTSVGAHAAGLPELSWSPGPSPGLPTHLSLLHQFLSSSKSYGNGTQKSPYRLLKENTNIFTVKAASPQAHGEREHQPIFRV